MVKMAQSLRFAINNQEKKEVVRMGRFGYMKPERC